MEDYYAVLGLNPSATADEIRRAYRVLARRYHPDVNPGKNSEEKFKAIAHAYDILGDSEKRKKFDAEWERHGKTASTRQRAADHGRARRRYEEALRRAQAHARPAQARPKQAAPQATSATRPPSRGPGLSDSIRRFWTKSSKGLRSISDEVFGYGAGISDKEKRTPARVSVIEVSLSAKDAVFGVKKTVEIDEPEGRRKLSIRVPPGVRNGSVLKLRSRGSIVEDLICILRVAPHPWFSLQPKGVVVEVPITIHEAIAGANITVPTFDDQIVLKIPAGTQSGTEFRIKDRGAPTAEGGRGDLFIRTIVRVPTCYQAVGIDEKAKALEAYYEGSVRQGLPKNLIED